MTDDGLSATETTARIYPNVQIGPGAQIGEFVIIGVPPRGRAAGELETRIGSGAIIRSHTVIYAGNQIGDDFQTGHGAMIREENQIGDQVSVGTGSVIEHHVIVGKGVRIHSHAFIPEFSVLEEGCWIGPHVALTNTLHPLCPKAKECVKGPQVGPRAKVGANVTILPGRKIGPDALVGAGSVVTEDVPARAVVVGNPARIIKWLDELDGCPYGLIDRPYASQTQETDL